MSEVDPLCPDCRADYNTPHREDCAAEKRRREEMDRIRAAHLKAEEAKGELIGEGEDGIYIEDGKGLDPKIVAYNEGGHNLTTVPITLVLGWVRANRPDLLVPELAGGWEDEDGDRERFTFTHGRFFLVVWQRFGDVVEWVWDVFDEEKDPDVPIVSGESDTLEAAKFAAMDAARVAS